ncbi:MAG: hypothetical protein ABIW79_06895, partial [Gemmatimonas sp.]
GFVFGRYVELQGFYLTNDGSAKSLGSLYDRLGVNNPPPGNPNLDIRNYGADVVLNFTAGALTPFVRGGGSVLRFEPDGGERFDQIALKYGGGLRFGKSGGLRVNLSVDDLRFRIDRSLFLALPENSLRPVDVDANKVRSSLVYGVGLTVPLGGSAVYDDRPEFSLANLSLPVEVFGGRVEFADASGIPRQNIAGVRTGIDFGPLVSLRGYYWRGVNDDFDATEKLRSYGGEAQFNLNAGPGLTPYLIGGGGQFDFEEGFPVAAGDSTGLAPRDRTALILGGGIRIPLGERLNLNVAARNYLMSRDGDLRDVSQSGQLRSNWSYTAGVSFALGGSRPSRERDRERARVATRAERDTVYIDRETGERMQGERMRDENARGERMGNERMRNVRLQRGERRIAMDAGETVRIERRMVNSRGDTIVTVDTMRRSDMAGRGMPGQGMARPGMDGDGYASGRTVTIPVPSEGEIIIRFGPQRPAMGGMMGMPGMMGGMHPSETMVMPVEGAARNDSTVRDLEQRLRARIDSLQRRVNQAGQPAPQRSLTSDEISALVRDELARDREMRDRAMRESEPRNPARMPTPPNDAPASVPDRERTGQPPMRDNRFSDASLYSGFTFSGGGQALLGGRVDAGQLAPSLRGVRLVPELAFGFGNGATSTYVAANALYEFSGFKTEAVGRIRPRLGLGLGLLNFSNPIGDRNGLDIVITPSYGVSIDLPALRNGLGAIGTPSLIVEHQGIAMFDVNRLLFGLTWRR